MAWVTVDALREHWERARVTAELITTNEPSVLLATENVAALSLNFGPGTVPFDITGEPKVQIDGTEIIVSPPLSDRSWTVHLRRTQGAWEEADSADDGTLAKRHGLQGPIDDAFMDSFLMVRPTGEPRNEQTAAWAKAELQHALTHWRQQFRGDARLKDDSQVTDDDIARHNLVLWGDPASNRVLAKLADKLPIRWDADAVVVGSAKYDAASHVPLLVYPNPLNPKRYVVLNSSFTYREYDYLNNARQTAKLPDWAVVDTRSPVTSQAPGKVVAAGFFDERWGLKP
jgi:hypothetical protein